MKYARFQIGVGLLSLLLTAVTPFFVQATRVTPRGACGSRLLVAFTDKKIEALFRAELLKQIPDMELKPSEKVKLKALAREFRLLFRRHESAAVAAKKVLEFETPTPERPTFLFTYDGLLLPVGVVGTVWEPRVAPGGIDYTVPVSQKYSSVEQLISRVSNELERSNFALTETLRLQAGYGWDAGPGTNPLVSFDRSRKIISTPQRPEPTVHVYRSVPFDQSKADWQTTVANGWLRSRVTENDVLNFQSLPLVERNEYLRNLVARRKANTDHILIGFAMLWEYAAGFRANQKRLVFELEIPQSAIISPRYYFSGEFSDEDEVLVMFGFAPEWIVSVMSVDPDGHEEILWRR